MPEPIRPYSSSGSPTSDSCATTSTQPARELEARDVRFLTAGIADVAGLRTAWFRDPWDNVFILLEKRARPDAPYYRQYRRAD